MLDINSLLLNAGFSGVGLALGVVALYILIQILSKLDYFHKYYTTKKFTRINNLILLKENLSNEMLKELSQEVIDEYLFKQFTNISANKKLRDFILTNYKEYDIELYHFRLASRFFKTTESGVEIKISNFDKIGMYLNYIFSALFLILVISVLGIFLIEENISFQKFLILLFLSCVFSISSVYILAQNLPLKSAIYLKEKLEI